MASSSCMPPRKYEIFLSFRGEDTRNTIVSHLYKALDQRGLVTYMDEHSLEKGQSISAELSRSIEESTFAIIVFSKTYASSTWCLDELVKIMECRAKYGQIVIPIFYDVNPMDVRKQNNSFAEAFAKHEANFRSNTEKVQIWKENLREAANIAGQDLSQRNVPEASCINKIVEDIFRKQPRKASAKGLVGIEYRVKKLRSYLAREPKTSCFSGIWGMGGIGKTTIARAIFDDLIGGFEGGCFLQDVSKRDIVSLQKVLLSKVLKLEHVNISDEYEGTIMIRTSLCSKRVLVVIDDVNNIKQLNSLAKEREWFGAGSKIVITTRDKHLLNEVNVTYEVELLTKFEASQLFSWHAFKNTQPTREFVELSDLVVNYACGLPLALEVLGSHLRGKGMDVWESTLARLKDAPEDTIFVTLKISFDSLNDFQQDIFLDIACFFRGHSEDEVKRKLHSFGFHPVDGISVLIQKSLLHILDGKIQMHDLTQEMGWNIVRQKSNKEPGRYSRIWDYADISDVLTNNTGTVEVEGLVLEEDSYIKLSEDVFKNMNKLRLLHINISNVSPQALNYLPNTLQWLHWGSYPAKYLPENFKPRNLVSLELRRSKIIQTPDISCMPNLEVLDLARCEELLEVHPSVGVHKTLIHLNLSWCLKLKVVPRILQMESLESLDLRFCVGLQGFPEIHSNMTSLRTLNLQRTNIQELPWSLGGLTSLREINLCYCKNLRGLPSSFCEFKYLESITLFNCSKLEYIFENPNGEAANCFDPQLISLKSKRPEEHHGSSMVLHAFLGLPLLRKLGMPNCNLSAIIIPETVGCLSSLQELDVVRNNFVSFPESINRFSCLQVFRLSGCLMLEALPQLPSSITELFLDDCTSLTRMPNLVDILDRCEDLHHFSLAFSEQLVPNQDQFDSSQTNAFWQSVPQFLSALWDRKSVSNVLCRRRKLLRVYLPRIEISDWLYQSMGPQVTFTLSPSWYNDKLRGIMICAISKAHNFTVVASNGLVTVLPGSGFIASYGEEHTTLFYIPIGRIISGIDWDDQKNCCLLEATNYDDHTTWGIRLVYDGKVDKDISDLMITNHYSPTASHEGARLKVCVQPMSHIQ